MGTSLINTKPKDTYTGIIKTGDNAGLTNTLKTLSDGAGNDSALELATDKVKLTNPQFTNGTYNVSSDELGYLDGVTSAIQTQLNAKQDTSANITLQGNTFNVADKLVQLDGTAKLPAVDGSQLTNLPTFSAPNGLLRIATAISTTLQTVTDYLNNVSVLQLNSRRIGILTDSSVTTQTSSVIQSTTTNAALVIAPNGTGALVAQIPDGTATGGNARGSNANDFQRSRTAASQVASGNNSVICGGSNNTASIEHNFIGGGKNNSTTGFDGYTSIVGGLDNTISTSGYSVISGGRSNSINTGGGSSPASVVGGQSNTGGAVYAVVGGGSNTASGRGSVAFGESNNLSASYASGLGYQGIGYLYGQFENASGFFAAVGDSQQSLLTARRAAVLTTAATTVLSLDGTGTTNLIIPSGNNRAWNVQVNWVAVVTAITGTATGITVGDVVTSIDLLAFKRVGGTSSASAHTSAATKTMVTTPTAYAACAIAYTAGASQEMALTFTGPTFVGGGSVTMRIVARIELSEVAW